MRVQFNLLPDIKIAYIKARRVKRLVILGSVIACGASIGLVVMLFLLVNVAEKRSLSQLDKSIKGNVSRLQSIEDIDKILTVQNQLESLPSLHQKKPVASRVFAFLSKLTPAQVTISKFTVDYTTNTVSIVGNTDKLETVNKFVDTIKFTTYNISGSKAPINAFSKVVLENFTRDDKTASYTISFSYDPVIFSSNTEKLELDVPKIITTRSQTEQPGSLFLPSNQTPSNPVPQGVR